MRQSGKALRKCANCNVHFVVPLGDIHTIACKKCKLYGVKLMAQFKEIIDRPEMMEFQDQIAKWYS